MSFRNWIFLFVLASHIVSAYGGEKEARAAYDREDYKTAFAEYKPLAEQGNAHAQFLLARMYDEGKGVVQDYKESLKWYFKSAEQDHAWAQAMLGRMHEIGTVVVAQNEKQAIKWYRRAAEQGNSYAQISLARMYEDGIGTPQDYKEAYAWYSVATADDPAVAVDRARMAEKLTPDQLLKGQELAKKYFEKYQSKQ